MSETSEEQQKGRPRALVWHAVPPEGRGGEPIEKLFAPRKDPKGWDRASITLNTHPLHPFPRVQQADLLLPKRTDRLKLIGDCAAFSFAVMLLAFFPLWLVGVVVNSRSVVWAWVAAPFVAILAGVVLYFRADDGEPEPDLF